MAKQNTEDRLVQQLVDDICSTAFVEGYQATDAECLGLVLSHHFHWQGVDILKTCYYALEDSNFHHTNETIERLIIELGGSL